MNSSCLRTQRRPERGHRPSRPETSRKTQPTSLLGAEALRVRLCGQQLDRPHEEAVDPVMQGFFELAVHPDVVEGIRGLNDLGIRLVTLSNGSAKGCRHPLARSGGARPVRAPAHGRGCRRVEAGPGCVLLRAGGVRGAADGSDARCGASLGHRRCPTRGPDHGLGQSGVPSLPVVLRCAVRRGSVVGGARQRAQVTSADGVGPQGAHQTAPAAANRPAALIVPPRSPNAGDGRGGAAVPAASHPRANGVHEARELLLESGGRLDDGIVGVSAGQDPQLPQAVRRHRLRRLRAGRPPLGEPSDRRPWAARSPWAMRAAAKPADDHDQFATRRQPHAHQGERHICREGANRTD